MCCIFTYMLAVKKTETETETTNLLIFICEEASPLNAYSFSVKLLLTLQAVVLVAINNFVHFVSSTSLFFN